MPPVQVLIELGVFDDGDWAPTQIICLWENPQPPIDALEDFILTCAEMRRAAEKEYGRAVPDHALFWSASPKPESLMVEALEQAE